MYTSSGLLKLNVAPAKLLSLTNLSNSTLPPSEPTGPHALTSVPLSTVAKTATNSTCANFIPGHIRGPEDHGAYPSGAGIKLSSLRRDDTECEAEVVEKREGDSIQRFGFQEEGELKVEGSVCMPCMLREISVLVGTMMVVV
jgi:hypothetical protein